jgi:hypothetical protein
MLDRVFDDLPILLQYKGLLKTYSVDKIRSDQRELLLRYPKIMGDHVALEMIGREICGRRADDAKLDHVQSKKQFSNLYNAVEKFFQKSTQGEYKAHEGRDDLYATFIGTIRP